MKKYRINGGRSDQMRDIEADYFRTEGDFIDFFKEGEGAVYRLRTGMVYTVEKVEE